MKFRFGEYTLDLNTRQLQRGPTDISLSTKAFDLLRLLIEARPRVLSKAELQDMLWPGIFVSQANLFTLISEIRMATKDTPRQPRFVRTVHGVGYAFSGNVVEVQSSDTQVPSKFLMISGTRSIVLREGESILGRDPDNPISLDSSTVSRRHARIVIAGNSALVEDLGSKNGTYINSLRIDSPAPLKDGDQIRIGSIVCTFRMGRPVLSTETEDL